MVRARRAPAAAAVLLLLAARADCAAVAHWAMADASDSIGTLDLNTVGGWQYAADAQSGETVGGHTGGEEDACAYTDASPALVPGEKLTVSFWVLPQRSTVGDQCYLSWVDNLGRRIMTLYTEKKTLQLFLVYTDSYTATNPTGTSLPMIFGPEMTPGLWTYVSVYMNEDLSGMVMHVNGKAFGRYPPYASLTGVFPQTDMVLGIGCTKYYNATAAAYEFSFSNAGQIARVTYDKGDDPCPGQASHGGRCFYLTTTATATPSAASCESGDVPATVHDFWETQFVSVFDPSARYYVGLTLGAAGWGWMDASPFWYRTVWCGDAVHSSSYFDGAGATCDGAAYPKAAGDHAVVDYSIGPGLVNTAATAALPVLCASQVSLTYVPTSAPDTLVPSLAPATGAPPSAAPPTFAPLTEAPRTLPPPTQAPETAVPLTRAPSTAAPATARPPTDAPSTRSPETAAPATAAPATESPETAAPATAAPATESPETAAPATGAPATQSPATAAPATGAPRTAAPATAGPETLPPATDFPAPPGSTEVPSRTDAPARAPGTAAPAGYAKTGAPDLAGSGTASPTADPGGETGPPGVSGSPFAGSWVPKVAGNGTAPTAEPGGKSQSATGEEDGAEAAGIPAGLKDSAEAVITGTSAVSVSAAKLAALMRFDCQVEDIDLGEDPLDWEFHPLHFGIGDSPQKYFIGAVVGNVLIVLGFLAINYLVVYGSMRVFNVTREVAVFVARAPGLVYIPCMWLLTGTAMAGSYLALGSKSTGFMTILGLVALLVCAAMPISIYYMILRPSCFYAVAVADPKIDAAAAELVHEADVKGVSWQHKGVLTGWKRTLYVLAYGEQVWVRSAAAPPYWVEAYGLFFEQFRKGYQWFGLAEMSQVFLIALLSSWRPGSFSSCMGRNALLSVLLLAFFASVVYLRPYNSHCDQFAASLMSGFTFVAITSMTISIAMKNTHRSASDGLMGFAGVLLLLSAAVLFVKGCYDIAFYFLDLKLGRRWQCAEIARGAAGEAWAQPKAGPSGWPEEMASVSTRSPVSKHGGSEICSPVFSHQSGWGEPSDLRTSPSKRVADLFLSTGDPDRYEQLLDACATDFGRRKSSASLRPDISTPLSVGGDWAFPAEDSSYHRSTSVLSNPCETPLLDSPRPTHERQGVWPRGRLSGQAFPHLAASSCASPPMPPSSLGKAGAAPAAKTPTGHLLYDASNDWLDRPLRARARRQSHRQRKPDEPTSPHLMPTTTV
ncbi:hypothetical protein DIPPA_33099 [Diplonema papillatum]|nr:hypothetical protein DIPPA_33099 [Diplonema papillatum]